MDFGLTEDEFWCLTPRQHYSLRKRKRNEIEHRELLNGIVAAAVANYSFGSKRKAMTAEDFMPSKWGRDESDPAKPRRRSSNAKVKKRWTDKDREKLATNIGTMMQVFRASGSPRLRVVYHPDDPNNPANKKETDGRQDQMGRDGSGSGATETAATADNASTGEQAAT